MSGDEGMKPASPGVKLTWDDYVLLLTTEAHELIDGEHVVTPTPNRKHQAISVNLHDPLVGLQNTHWTSQRTRRDLVEVQW
jgi:hypothetical protein